MLPQTTMQHTSGTVAERVARGAAFLDEVAPGWESKVDLGTLRLSNSVDCICGQVWGGKGEAGYYFFERTLASEGIAWLNARGINTLYAATAFGFDIEVTVDRRVSTTEHHWSALQDAWTALIKTRYDLGELSV